MLQVADLNVRYRTGRATHPCAVGGVNFQIARGETLGLMGESGSGKTSIALTLLGLLTEDQADISGSILFNGQDLRAMDERRFRKIRGKEISMVYQEPGIALSPVMRAGTQVAEVVHAHHDWTWDRCREEARGMLERVGLPATERIYSAYPHQLSGGQLQRVILAQALICRPALVVADEPTASLDARSQSDFIALLRELKNRMQLSILLISHTPEVQACLADRLMVMKDGRIVEQGSFESLYLKPLHPYTKALLRRDRPGTGGRDFKPDPAAQRQFVG